MVRPQLLLFIAFLLLLGNMAYAQPSLPSIAAKVQGGAVVLVWNSQYDGIQSIAVKRSVDSSFNYKTIGYVKTLEQGLQFFVDAHPEPGKSYYKLAIVFNSGLNWKSDHVGIFVDPAESKQYAGMQLSKDSVKSIANLAIEHLKNSDLKQIVTSNAASTINKLAEPKQSVQTPISYHPSFTAEDLSYISFPVKFNLSTPANDLTDPVGVRSGIIGINPIIGHLLISLPADYSVNVYSVSFADEQGRVLYIVDHLTRPTVIIDKRSFPRTGVYKYVLRRNGNMLEYGQLFISF